MKFIDVPRSFEPSPQQSGLRELVGDAVLESAESVERGLTPHGVVKPAAALRLAPALPADIPAIRTMNVRDVRMVNGHARMLSVARRP
jgi:hypothetical protein